MNRRSLLSVGGVALAAAAGGAGWRWWHSQQNTIGAAEQSLWTQHFERPEGGELAMAPLRGKPLLLNFWATWCAPCVKEMPMLDAFHREHQPEGWQVVGLAIDEAAPVREFLARVVVGFPIGLAGLAGVDLSRAFGNDRGGLPFSVVFDRRGKAVFRKLGTVEKEDLVEWVSELRQRH